MTNIEEFILNLPKELREGVEKLAQDNINGDKTQLLRWFFSQSVRKEPIDFNEVAKLLKRHFNNRVDVAFNTGTTRFRIMISCRDLPKENEKKEEGV